MDKLQIVYTSDTVNVVRCKDCKHYEVKDHWLDFGKVPVLVSDVPTCHRWGDGNARPTRTDTVFWVNQRRM